MNKQIMKTAHVSAEMHLDNQTPINTIVPFQPIDGSNSLGDAVREAISKTALEFYVPKQPQKTTVEDITALYERLSQEDGQEGESNSIGNQKKILERYCHEHGYSSIRHYEDDGYSGTNFNRPGFQEMLKDIKEGKISRVIVKDMSRLGRNYLQVGMYTDILFSDMGVHFIAVNDGVDSTREDNEFTAIRNVFNEMYARDTSKKIRATWKTKGSSGERLTSIPPYGYRKDPKDKKKWIIEPEAAATVQKIFSLCMDGLGPTQIARWLREKKVLNPVAYCKAHDLPTANKAPVDPYRWTNETVSRMLERVEYLGHTVNFRTKQQSFKNKKTIWNDPSEWAIFENTQEPIIEESVFLIVQNIRQSRRRPNKMGEMGMFSGLLFCADCGGKMYQCRTNKFKPEQEYFICSTYRKDRTLCTTHSIRNMPLGEIVLQNLREAIAYVTEHEAAFIEEAAETDIRARNKAFAQKKDSLTQAEKRIVELDLIIKRIYEDNISGKLTDERFMKLSRDYELEQDNLLETVKILHKEIKQQEKCKTNVKSFINIVRKYTDMSELDPTILREFIDKILVSKNSGKKGRGANNRVQEIEIVYNFIGAFDFGKVHQQTETNYETMKVGIA